ncbi:MAG: DUF4293 domain-containing protein [Alistipes sp.]|nr:DUF4293 domain-containing protein [Alistipes sp.]
MIQRIQTLYLVVITSLMAITLFAPIATFTVATGDVYTLSAFELSNGQHSQSTIWMGILLVLATVLPLVTIFLFKNRQLQLRLCGAEVVLLIGAIVFVGIYYWLSSANALENVGVEHRSFGWAAIMPLLSLVMAFLAARRIFKDEVLVRSLDRIR